MVVGLIDCTELIILSGGLFLAEVAAKRSWEFPTLIWMRPYNKGRANSVRQHVERLSRILHLLHIKHINWAVSAECESHHAVIIMLRFALPWQYMENIPCQISLGGYHAQFKISANTDIVWV